MVHLIKIKEIAFQKNIKLTELAWLVGITNPGLHHLIKSNSTSIQTLQKIADALEVPIETFFRLGDEEGNGYSNETLLQIHAAEIKERIEYTQRLEEIISLQRDLITFLKNNQKP